MRRLALGNIQKVRDGERLDGKSSALGDFEGGFYGLGPKGLFPFIRRKKC